METPHNYNIITTLSIRDRKLLSIKWGKSRFTVVHTQNTVYSCITIYSYCIIFHMHNCKLTFAPHCYVYIYISLLCIGQIISLKSIIQKTELEILRNGASWDGGKFGEGNKCKRITELIRIYLTIY